jgi:small subunit ribosomal protein S3
MGQKIHPVGLRLGITRTWDSRWFEKKHYIDWLHEDVAIRKYFNKWQRSAGISKIEIERRANQARVIINTAKPGIIIGKRGVGIEDIRKSLEKLTGKNVQVNVMEIKHPEVDARLIGQNIVDQLEKRIAFRRAMKQAIMRTMKAGALGVKVQCSARCRCIRCAPISITLTSKPSPRSDASASKSGFTAAKCCRIKRAARIVSIVRSVRAVDSANAASAADEDAVATPSNRARTSPAASPRPSRPPQSRSQPRRSKPSRRPRSSKRPLPKRPLSKRPSRKNPSPKRPLPKRPLRKNPLPRRLTPKPHPR